MNEQQIQAVIGQYMQTVADLSARLANLALAITERDAKIAELTPKEEPKA